MKSDSSHEEKWLWWKHGVIYHIYPRSFSDSNNDGIGDLRGIIQKLPYLSDLGIDAIWLSPVYPSPMIDFGYDISDYQQIDPVFGSLEDFRELLGKAHQKNIRVVMDLVMNHTSDQHHWFRSSRSSKESPHRDWYIWKKGRRGRPPNNWKTVFGGSAWEYDSFTGEYYLHTFFKEQPDLNWQNPELRKTFFNGIRFWLEMGVDGFRVDVLNLLGKDTQFRDHPIPFGIPLLQRVRFTLNKPEAYRVARELRSLLNTYPERMCVAEVYSVPPGDARVAASFLQGGDAMNMAFDFTLMLRSWSARNYFRAIKRWYALLPEKGWPCHVLSNHDLHRHFDRFAFRRNKEKKARVSAMLLMTLKGTPFLYYGDEIGMRNARLSRSEIKDPLGKIFWPIFRGRDKGRTPMQWSPEPHAGFSQTRPWLPVNEDYPRLNVGAQAADERSFLHFYRNLIQLRKKHSALHRGEWSPLTDGKNGILVYLREYLEERILVILNFTRSHRKIRIPNQFHGEVLLSTHRPAQEELPGGTLLANPFEATLVHISAA